MIRFDRVILYKRLPIRAKRVTVLGMVVSKKCKNRGTKSALPGVVINGSLSECGCLCYSVDKKPVTMTGKVLLTQCLHFGFPLT